MIVGSLWAHRIHVLAPQFEVLSSSDVVRYSYPTAVFLRNELLEGRLPLWDPYQLAGFPVLAAQATGILYPPNLLLLAAIPAEAALASHAVLHIFLAGLFVFLLLRRLELRRGAALAAAIAFALSEPVLIRVYTVFYLSTLVWAPALCWALVGLAKRPRLQEAAIAAFCAAMGFLGGDAQGFLYGSLLAAFFAAALGLFLVGQRPRFVGLSLVAAVWFLGWIAPQLLPTLELSQLGARGLDGLSLAEASWGFLPWRSIALAHFIPWEGWISSAPHGQLAPRVTWLALAALPLALWRRPRWLGLTFASAALLTGLFMMGPSTPVFRVHHALPLGDLFRSPARMAPFYGLIWSILLGLGLDQLLCWASERTRVASRLASGLAVGLITVDAWVMAALPWAVPISWDHPRTGPPELVRFLEQQGQESRTFIEDWGHIRSLDLLYKLGMMNRVPVVPDYQPMIPGSYADYFGKQHLWHGGLSVLETPRHPSDPELPRLLDLMSARYWAAQTARSGVIEGLARLQTTENATARRVGNSSLFLRETAVPRAYVVGRTRVLADARVAREHIVAPDFDPRAEAVVAEGPSLDGELRGSVGAARIRLVKPHRVIVDASCHAECLLVLTDLYYPGWSARVGHEEAAIVRTNAIFRGVRLEAGRHRVAFVYRPNSFRVGAILFVLSTAIALIALLWARRSEQSARA